MTQKKNVKQIIIIIELKENFKPIDIENYGDYKKKDSIHRKKQKPKL